MKEDLVIPAIKTKYKNIKFRSRLEARWAAFFDLLKWDWEYEPIDCNGWIPDFVLYGKHKEILVEVKPYSKLKQFNQKKYLDAIKNTIWERKEILYLGNKIFQDERGAFDNWPIIGWLMEWVGESRDDPAIAYAVLNFYEKKFGFIHQYMTYSDRITGLYDGDHFLYPPNFEEVKRLWVEAYQKTKYR